MLKNPYYTLFFAVLSMVVIALNQQEERHPISFVFDEQGSVGVRALEMMQIIKQNIHSHFTSSEAELLVGLPSFSDDKKMTPLQAADLYAGNVRRFYIDKDNRNIIIPLRQSMRELSVVPSFSKALNARELSLSAAKNIHRFLPRKESDDVD